MSGLSLSRVYLCALLTFAIAGTASATGLDRATRAKLAALPQEGNLRIESVPVGAHSRAAIRFQRVNVYAPDAHIYAATEQGLKELPKSTRVFLRGYADDGSARLALALNPDGSFIDGNGMGPEGSFAMRAHIGANGATTIQAQSLESTLPPGFNFDFRCGNENREMDVHGIDALAKQLQSEPPVAASAPSAFRLGTIGIDTDSLFMSKLFSNNTTNATNWIASMFNTINTMYEGDLQVKLLIGTTILRTSSANDPYTSASDVNADTHDLDIFAAYWKANESSIHRSFAILLSGQESSTSNSCSASGIAWVDEYCQTGFASGGDTVGSYSVNQVCTNLNIDPNGTFDARIVGHEIGHNFGTFHTHCTNTSTGAAPTGTNTIDQCYNVESGCYAGTPSCPAAGAGTIMSYCNFTNVSGCASGTQNLLQFHSTQVNDVLLPDIAANTPSCLSIDEIFADGFQ